MKKMKGISPIIAIIIILLITIAIAGAAYAYISMFWQQQTKAIQFLSSSCSGGVATLTFKNIGTQDIAATEITATRTSPSAVTFNIEAIAIGGTGKVVEAAVAPETSCGAGSTCIYTVTLGTQSHGPLPVVC